MISSSSLTKQNDDGGQTGKQQAQVGVDTQLECSDGPDCLHTSGRTNTLPGGSGLISSSAPNVNMVVGHGSPKVGIAG